MTLFFYGGGEEEENLFIDKKLVEILGKEKTSITYIPACSYALDDEFEVFKRQYTRMGFSKVRMFEIDKPFSSTLKKSMFKSDVIHLGGGNTYHFLEYLKKSKLNLELKAWLESGGVLTGLSAGAIVMTHNISTAGIPSFDKDDNEKNMKNLKGMNLVNFEFFPHYKNSSRYDKELKAYSLESSRPLYACPDGSGIIVEKDEIRFVGKVYCFSRGLKQNIHT